MLTPQVFIDIHNEIRDAKKASSEANVYDAFIPIDIKEDVVRTYMVYLGGHGKRDVLLIMELRIVCHDNKNTGTIVC